MRPIFRIPALPSLLAIALLIFGALLTACSAPSVTYRRPEVHLEGKARVKIERITATNIFVFTVVNLSREILVVDRNAVRLQTPAGTMLREAGGAASFYMIPPGGMRRVNVKFNIEYLPDNTAVRVLFSKALSIRDEVVDIDPIELIVE